MAEQAPKTVAVGSLVLYRLTSHDVVQSSLQRGSRTFGPPETKRLRVTALRSAPVASVDGQVLLDEGDAGEVYAVERVVEGSFPGQWSWPPVE